MRKEVKVVLSEEADKVYEELNEFVGEEKKRGVFSSFNQTLLRSIKRVKELLEKNPFAGNQIPKKRIPKKYLLKYGVENLWRIELANRWRLIYTITGNEIEIINFILDVFNHKRYDKVFGYK
jgi:Txe/YoeB family toxin of Txe-Axe toxin-antitoxin module